MPVSLIREAEFGRAFRGLGRRREWIFFMEASSMTAIGSPGGR